MLDKVGYYRWPYIIGCVLLKRVTRAITLGSLIDLAVGPCSVCSVALSYSREFPNTPCSMFSLLTGHPCVFAQHIMSLQYNVQTRKELYISSQMITTNALYIIYPTFQSVSSYLKMDKCFLITLSWMWREKVNMKKNTMY